jgi:hypothetical protein
VSRLQQRDTVGSYCLCRNPHRFGHGEIDRKLDHFEMMLRAAYFTGNGYELLETEVVSSFG